MQIKIHNVDSFVRAITDGKFRTFGKLAKMGVLVGPRGIVLVCSNGIHWRYDEPDDAFTLYLEQDTKGCYSLEPTHATKCTVQDIMDAEFEEKSFSEFVQSAQGSDYKELLRSIESIGLPPSNFKG